MVYCLLTHLAVIIVLFTVKLVNLILFLFSLFVLCPMNKDGEDFKINKFLSNL